MKYAIFILFGYLSGSILYACLLPKYLCHVDVREKSRDGNPGTANAFLYGGKAVGCLVIVLELAKGFFPVYAARGVLDTQNLLFGLVIAAPAAGHAFPVFRPGKGGKAIAVSFGCLLGLIPDWKPVLLLAVLYLFFSILLVIRPHLYRSVITFLLFSSGSFLMVQNRAYLAGILLLSVIVIWKHLIKYQHEKFSIRWIWN